MSGVLVSWVGATDLEAAKGTAVGDGPIAQAVASGQFEHVVLLSSYSARKDDVGRFRDWLATRTSATIEIHDQELRAPTNYEDIYGAVVRVMAATTTKFGPRPTLTFHLSPGTPAMAAVWILVSPKYGAKLIQTSRERGLEDANVPFEIAAEFVPALVRTIEAGLERLGDAMSTEDPQFGDIYFRSATMRKLVERAQRAAPYGAPILIEGESGTGKELLAAAIHGASGRKGKFIPVNCGAIPKDLVESLFFGHKKGAFSGAIADQTGYFEHAHEGTLFLDEIGELPLDAQAKLLRALQVKKVQRVGDPSERGVDVRIIAATNRDLLVGVRSGTFRDDLYFRLAMLVLKSPPLREREGDIGELAERFLSRINDDEAARIGGGRKSLSAAAKRLLINHSWPGNVRELQATLLRAFVWSKKDIIEERDMREALVTGHSSSTSDVMNRELGDDFKLQNLVGEVVRHYLKRALDEAQGNKTRAASLIGFASYQTLTYWLRKYKVGA